MKVYAGYYLLALVSFLLGFFVRGLLVRPMLVLLAPMEQTEDACDCSCTASEKKAEEDQTQGTDNT